MKKCPDRFRNTISAEQSRAAFTRRLILFVTAAVCLFCFSGPGCARADYNESSAINGRAQFHAAKETGRLGDKRLVECSGIDISLLTEKHFWAVNDGGSGPFIYALAMNGRSLGRLLIEGAKNRDWEALDTFVWNGRPMILIADFGDNSEKHDIHRLYILEEPSLEDPGSDYSNTVEPAWRIVFSYPDGRHDAEAAAVDPGSGRVLFMTKRDSPPLLYELPLKPDPSKEPPLTARKLGTVRGIPGPSNKDLLKKHGELISKPTAMDISPDGSRAVVLTYKHAYIFSRGKSCSWAAALNKKPLLVPLPLGINSLRQREAVCFAPDGRSLFVTSEGSRAGIYFLEAE